MPEQHTYDYAVIRVVPRVERGEFVNVGVILWCAPRRFLKAKLHVDEKKVLALDPSTDIEAIKSRSESLAQLAMKMGEEMYRSQQQTSAPQDNNEGEGKTENEEKVVDADFQEVNNNKRKKP